jgi:hypothetical protein
MKTHPLIPGDPLVLFFNVDGVTRSVTTWARTTDPPGWTAIRAGISPKAHPLTPSHDWYPLSEAASNLTYALCNAAPDWIDTFWNNEEDTHGDKGT